MLDDGTVGLSEIKQRGGLALVQDPSDATYPSMPESALRFVDVDLTAPLAELGRSITLRCREVVVDGGDVRTPGTDTAGAVSAMTCPLCHGALWEHHHGPLVRFACRVGHSFTEAALASNLAQEAEDALWIALRVLEENRDLNRRISRRAAGSVHVEMAARFEAKAHEAECQMLAIRRLIQQRAGDATIDAQHPSNADRQTAKPETQQ
jgi:two-component system chemotaxis response regulator CheB